MKILPRQPLIDAFATAMGGTVASANPPKTAEIVTLPRAHQLTTEILDKATAMTRDEPTIGGHVFDQGDWAEWSNELASGGRKSQSDADLALCGFAARNLEKLGVTDPDELRAGVRQIMERSALSQRGKWQRDDYSEGTITKAVAPILARQTVREAGGDTESQGGEDKASQGPDLRRGDILAGEMFVDQHQDRIRYCSERGAYLRWNGARWEWASPDDALELAKDTAGTFLDTAKATMRFDPEKGGKVAKFAVRYHTLDGMRAMIATAKSDPRIRVKLTELDADPFLLGVQNGYVDLRTGQFYPPDPSKLITRVTGMDYVAGATCPQWLQALDAIHEGNQDTVDFLQRAYGYTFSGRNDEEVMFVCYGFGENGKSVQADVIHYVGGDIVCIGDVSLLVYQKNDTRVPNALAATAGARLLSLNETQGNDELNTQALKMVAGREPVTARFLHQEFFTFQPTATPWLRTNHRPIVKDDSQGTWRRLVPIHFRHQFTDADKDPRIEDKLRAEGPGILNWIIAGAVEYFKRGLRIPACIRQDANAYRTESDILGQFLDSETEADPTYRAEQHGVWNLWRTYCAQNGHHAGTKITFSRRLKERGHPEAKSSGTRFYRGLKIRGAQGGVVPPRAEKR
jgi:putative DNA primase/helicase